VHIFIVRIIPTVWESILYHFGFLRTGVIFPSLLQLQRGITDVEERKQRETCATKYKRKDDSEKGKLSEIDLEREEECGICMEMNSKVVLPICSHSMCMKCYRNWYANCYELLAFIIIYFSNLSSTGCYPMKMVRIMYLFIRCEQV
jgi:hypothetical protein